MNFGTPVVIMGFVGVVLFAYGVYAIMWNFLLHGHEQAYVKAAWAVLMQALGRTFRPSDWVLFENLEGAKRRARHTTLRGWLAVVCTCAGFLIFLGAITLRTLWYYGWI